jgi:hypothetical protein
MQNVRHPQAPADVQHGLQSAHFGQELALLPLHDPPPDPDPDDDDEPPEELELIGAPHEPPLQTWPEPQVVQASPPEPHVATVLPLWHVLVESQQPWQLAPEHPVASSPPLVPPDPPLDPLSSPPPVDPASSPPPDPPPLEVA